MALTENQLTKYKKRAKRYYDLSNFILVGGFVLVVFGMLMGGVDTPSLTIEDAVGMWRLLIGVVIVAGIVRLAGWSLIRKK
jgi:hypothetical protein